MKFLRHFNLLGRALIRLGVLFVALLILGISFRAYASNATWNGTTDSSWATATNWSATPVPGTGDTATFNNAGNAHTTLSLGAGVTIGTVLFDTANVAAYTIGSGAVGSQTLTMDNGGAVTMNAAVANSQRFNSAIVLGTSTAAASYTFTNDSPTNSLTFAGNISRNGTTNTKTLTVGGAGNTTISGVIGSGAIALTKSGTGKLTLTGTNTFTGAVKVSQGILNIQNASALGTTAGGIAIGDAANQIGATLQLEGGITVGNEPISLTGGFDSHATGGLESVSGTNNYGGLITFVPIVAGSGFQAYLSADAGSTLNITNTGAMVGNSVTLSLTGEGTGNLASVINTSVAGVAKYGTGTWTLTAANTFAGPGPFTIFEGTLKLSGSGKLGSTAVDLKMNGGTLDLGGTSQSVSTLAGSGGGTGLGTILNNGGGTSTLTVGNNNDDGSFDGVIIDNDNATAGKVALIKVGTGTFSLGAANSYSGATSINAGVFVIGNGSSLGATGNGAAANGTTVASGASLILGGDCVVGAEALTIGGVGTSSSNGALESNGDDTWGGTIALTANTTIASNFGTFSLTNAISGAARTLTLTGAGDGVVSSVIGTTSGGLTKAGLGKWTLSGANTFTGAVTISAGILNVQNATALGTTAGATSISVSGATLQIQGDITIGNETLTIRGAGASGTTGALQNVSGTNNFGGLLSLAADSTISSDAGTLNLTNPGTINDAFNLILAGAGNGSIASIIGIGAHTVTKNGAGTWTLSGVNTFTGALAINAGAIAIATFNNVSAAGPFGNSATAVALGSASAMGTLQYTGGTASSSKPLQALNLGAVVQVDSAAAELTLTGGISGSGALLKTGPGTLTLAGADSFAGNTTVSAGVLKAAVGAAISASSLITVQSSATLQLAGTGDRIGNAVPLTLAGGTFSTAGLSGQTETLGNLAVSANSTIDFGTGSGDSLIFAGVGAHTAGAKLSITNWSGTPYQLGSAANDRLIFNGSATAFLYNPADVSFNGIPGYVTYQYDAGHFELLGIPEPSISALLGAGVFVGFVRRTRSRWASR